MQFEKNQEIFNNEISRKIWTTATLMVPADKSTVFIDDSLLKESCIEFYNYKYVVYIDMYENPNAYYLDSQYKINDYNELLICLLQVGIITDDGMLLLDSLKFNETISIRSWRFSAEKMIKVLERQGVICEEDNGIIVLSSKLYPKMFYASKELVSTIERYKNNRTEREKYFHYCEFRAFEDKFRRNFDTLIETLSDKRIITAHTLHKFALENKIKPVTRIYYNDLQYHYKSRRALHLNSNDNMLNVKICFGDCYELLCEEIDKRDDSGKLKKYLFKNVRRCDGCGGIKNTPCGKYHDVDGEQVALCPLFVTINDCKDSDIPYIMQLLDICMDFINAGIY